jgi:opacity protein-like surface antigen
MMRFVNLLGLILLIAIAALMFTAPAARADKGARTLEEDNWALQFGIRSDLTLGTFESGSISFKQLLSQRSALRYGISVHYSYSGSNSEVHDTRDDLSVIYQRYVNPDATAKFYWGTGPYLLFGYNYRLHSSDNSYDERIQKQLGAGWYGVGGVEWFVTDVISLHAEYRVSAIYLWQSYRLEAKGIYSDVRVTEYEVDAFNFSNNGDVLFGLSVYF